MASATIASFFSTAITPHLSSKLSKNKVVLRVTCPARACCKILTLNHIRDHQSSSLLRRVPRTFSVAEETSTASVEEEEQQDVKEIVEEGEEEVAAAAAPQKTKLYFGNLPYNCDSAQLAGVIQEYANPEMVEVLYDRETGRSRGFAFVTMSTVEDCEAVINNLDGKQFGGRAMKVNFSDKPKPKLPLYPETEFKLFIGNLSWSVTAEMLIEKFQECGNVVGARVIYDGDTGRSKGYGFVCYSSKEEMDNALQTFDGQELEGRQMRVNVAMGKRS